MEEKEEKNGILVVKIYLQSGQVILSAFKDLDWKHSKGEITSISADYLEPEEIKAVKSRYPKFEFLRLDLMNIRSIKAVSIIENLTQI